MAKAAEYPEYSWNTRVQCFGSVWSILRVVGPARNTVFSNAGVYVSLNID